MSKMSELAAELQELRRCGETLISISETLVQMFSTPADSKASDVAESEATTKAPEKKLTLEDVRAVLAEKSRAGHTAQVKALIKKHGADKLSEIDPMNYAALLADAEVL